MNYLADLKPHIGSEKTLVISGGHPNHKEPNPIIDSVYLFDIPQGMLSRYDRSQYEILMHYICEQECSQVIYVAPRQPAMFEALENSDSPRSLHLSIKFHLSVLLGKHEDRVVSNQVRRQMLLELYTIEQCKMLMEYFFIKRKIDQGDLKLKGLVSQMGSEKFESVFFNGISYNNLITLN